MWPYTVKLCCLKKGDDPMIEVGARIRSWRKAQGLSQKALAGRIGTAGNLIGVYERGESSPTLHQLRRICKALRIRLDELLAGPPPVRLHPAAGLPLSSTASVNDTICPIPYIEHWNGEPSTGLDVIAWPISRALLPHDGCLITRIPDNAMYPELIRDDAVLVDPEVQRPRSGSLILLGGGRQVRVRRYRIRKRGRIFEASNPNHATIVAGPGIRTLGRVIALVERKLTEGSAADPSATPAPPEL